MSVNQLITSTGTSALWVGFVCMALSALVFAYYAYTAGAKSRIFNYLSAAIVTIASLAYLVMALGNSQVSSANGRDFLWARYADWLLTTPLLLLDLGLLSGAPLVEVTWAIFCDVIMVLAGYAAVVSKGEGANWPLFIFGMVVFAPILHSLFVTFKEAAHMKGIKTANLYSNLSWLMAVTWCAYPIIWAAGEGSQSVSVDTETILYVIFDVTAKCVFGFVLVSGHAHIQADEAAAGLIHH